MSIPEYFKGQTILLTGATGSVGSVFLEKLLRSCKGVKKVYVLVRPRNGLSAEERVISLFQQPLYSNLEKSDTEKVQAVHGDVTDEKMGISQEDHQRLAAEVTIVFHAAARVFFNASLKSAVTSNLIGTKRILDLCHQMVNLESLIYVSTAYCNCPIKETTERLYPVDYNPEDVINMIDTIPAEKTKKTIGLHPNTYTFSKQLAEHLVVEGRGHIKVAIVRPSIVIGTWQDPFPGWIDAGTGATGFIAGAGAGCFRTSQVSPKKVADLIPSDILVNALLAAAWDLGQTGSHTTQIYHVTSGLKNPITWGQYTEYIDDAIVKFPIRKMLWYPKAKARSSKWRNTVVVHLFQMWPSYILDAVRTRFSGKPKESLVSIQQKFIRGMVHTHYFCKQQWQFHNHNLNSLINKLSAEDREVFNMSIEKVDWKVHMENCVRGVRENFHKDPPHTLEQARKSLKKWRAVHIGAHWIAFFWMIYVAKLLFGDLLFSTALSVMVMSFIMWI